MLILQRKAGEFILIGDDIRVTVVSVEAGGRVRLAVDAPRSMPILRNELRAAMDINQAAAKEEAPPAELMNYLGKMVRSDERAADPDTTKPHG